MKQEHLVHRNDAEPSLPGRTIHPDSEALRRGEPGWPQRNWHESEFEQRREGEIEAEEYDAARDWLRHVESGRIGGRIQGV